VIVKLALVYQPSTNKRGSASRRGPTPAESRLCAFTWSFTHGPRRPRWVASPPRLRLGSSRETSTWVSRGPRCPSHAWPLALARCVKPVQADRAVSKPAPSFPRWAPLGPLPAHQVARWGCGLRTTNRKSSARSIHRMMAARLAFIRTP